MGLCDSCSKCLLHTYIVSAGKDTEKINKADQQNAAIMKLTLWLGVGRGLDH